jgi:membrane-associated phospholipid phosphatase
LIPALRLHHVSGIDLGALRGLVCAPSFHTASAVLYMWAAWPVVQLRRVVVPLNCAMLLATPIEGTHYLSDMIAGAAVAGCAIVVVVFGLRWTGRHLLHEPERGRTFARVRQPG